MLKTPCARFQKKRRVKEGINERYLVQGVLHKGILTLGRVQQRSHVQVSIKLGKGLGPGRRKLHGNQEKEHKQELHRQNMHLSNRKQQYNQEGYLYRPP